MSFIYHNRQFQLLLHPIPPATAVKCFFNDDRQWWLFLQFRLYGFQNVVGVEGHSGEYQRCNYPEQGNNIINISKLDNSSRAKNSIMRTWLYLQFCLKVWLYKKFLKEIFFTRRRRTTNHQCLTHLANQSTHPPIPASKIRMTTWTIICPFNSSAIHVATGMMCMTSLTLSSQSS